MDKETTNLIEGLRRQDGHAQRRMLQMYGGMVFSLVSRIVPGQEDAEEACQDVFIKALRAIGSYDPQKASLPVWLSRIAYHEALNIARRCKPPVVYTDEMELSHRGAEDGEAAMTLLQQDERTIEMLEKALEHLSPREQALITMFYYDDMSIKEIAYVTGTGASTVGSQLCRTRQKIYRIIRSMEQ